MTRRSMPSGRGSGSWPRPSGSWTSGSRWGAERSERTPGRKTSRTGDRERAWDTRVGTNSPAHPHAPDGGSFPSLLQPRRRAERALGSVVQDASGAGGSTRRVDDLVRALGLEGVSRREVSRLWRELSSHGTRRWCHLASWAAARSAVRRTRRIAPLRREGQAPRFELVAEAWHTLSAAGISIQRSAQAWMAWTTGSRPRPFAVSRYSTATGFDGWTIRSTKPSRSSSCSRSDTMRSLNWGAWARKSLNRRGPSMRMRNIRPVHFLPSSIAARSYRGQMRASIEGDTSRDDCTASDLTRVSALSNFLVVTRES